MKQPVRIVIDTNVLVSGLLKGNSPPGHILDLIIAGKIIPVLEQRIFDEYTNVLARPRLHIAPETANKILTYWAAIGEWVVPLQSDLSKSNIQDPNDLPFIQAAISAQVWALVTGNQRHFMLLADYGIRVLTPAEFLLHYSEQAQ